MHFPKQLAGISGLLLVLSLAGCSKPDEQVKGKPGEPVFFNDFEAVKFWGGAESQSIVKGDAHSGQFAVKVDAQNEYGYPFKGKLNQLLTTKPIRAEITAWAKLDRVSSAVIVFNISKPEGSEGENYWNTLNLTDQVKDYGKWVRIKKEFTLPINMNMESELACYLWRTSATEPAMIDDLQIKLVTE
jgi:hypothetical protein